MGQTTGHSNDPPRPEQDEELLWEQIAEKIDTLVAAWANYSSELANEPDLEPLVADLPPHQRITALGELIKVDLEHRWQEGRAPRKVESYFEQFPELRDFDAAAVGLVFEEIQIRRQAGEEVGPGEIHERFPEYAVELTPFIGSLALPGSPNETFVVSDVRLAEPADNRQLLKTTTYRGTPPKAAEPPGDQAELAVKEMNALNVGDSIEDFDLLLSLGRGAFARVFLARQRSMERLVALKITIDDSSEPQTLAQLDHPNIVHVFDQRSWGEPTLRLLYMEVVGGGTLQEVIRRIVQTPPPERSGSIILEVVDKHLAANAMAPPEGSTLRQSLATCALPDAVCHIGARLADGLAYAHAKGVLHRDIKPANVLLTAEGSPKLADFNISFNSAREAESPTDVFGGSLSYMSPEQLAACHPLLGGSPYGVHEASDVYSLGVVLSELALGQRPFDNPEPGQKITTAIQRMIDTRVDVSHKEIEERLTQDCPPPLRRVLVRALSPQPVDRFRSASQFAKALRLCLQPRAWKLLQAPTSRLGKTTTRFPVVMVILATLLPNIVVAAMNFLYNKQTLIPQLPSASLNTFMLMANIVNGVAFPLGIGVGVIGVYRATRLLFASPPDQPAPGGRRVLFLGRFMALIDVVLWCVAGLAYSTVLHLDVPSDQLVTLYIHFLTSLTLYGLLAATYPFFLVTFLCVRWLTPTLIRHGVTQGPTSRDYDDLKKLMRFFLVLAAAVPLLSVLLTLAWYDQQKDLLIILTVSGMGFVGLYYLLYRPIEEDLNALSELAPDNPNRFAG